MHVKFSGKSLGYRQVANVCSSQTALEGEKAYGHLEIVADIFCSILFVFLFFTHENDPASLYLVKLYNKDNKCVTK